MAENKLQTITNNISLQTTPISTKNFGGILILSTKTRTGKPDLVTVTDVSDLLDAGVGFVVGDDEYKMAEAIFSQSPRASEVTVFYIGADYSAVAATLGTLKDSLDWYWTLAPTRTPADIHKIADWIETQKMVYGTTVNFTNSSIIDTIVNKKRTFVLVSESEELFPDAAWIGRCATVPIGSVAWDHKLLSGQGNSGLSQANQNTVLGKYGNVIAKTGGLQLTNKGTMVSGNFIDTINKMDYIEAELATAWYNLKVNSNQVTFDSTGFAVIEATLRGAFNKCGNLGIIKVANTASEKSNSDLGDFQYKLSIPDSSSISANDQNLGKASGITYKCYLTNSVVTIELTGDLTF